MDFQSNIQKAAATFPFGVAPPPGRVDTDISEEHFTTLVKHVQRTWEQLGAEQPHWSVLTNPKFLPGNIAENTDDFYKSARRHWRRFESASARAGKPISRDATAFELGCGVGRMTAALAKRFRQVIACDISQPHLDLAKAHLESVGLRNVTTLRLTGLDTLETLPAVDCFYSIMVLQHNPPPLITEILEIVFSKLREGGIAYFQIPVAARRPYRFKIGDYLKRTETDKARMEMHILPQRQLFRLLEQSGMRMLDFQMSSGPQFQSVSILAEKCNYGLGGGPKNVC